MFIHLLADNPITTCFHGDVDSPRGQTCKVPTSSLMSPRFLKSQPALSNVAWRQGNSQRMLKSQPFMYIDTKKQGLSNAQRYGLMEMLMMVTRIGW